VAKAKLVIVPAPEVLPAQAAIVLQEAKRWSRILVTGALEGDPYGRVTPALRELGIAARSVPLSLREPTRWTASGAPAEGWATFPDNRTQWLRRAAVPEPMPPAGSVWHEPLPLEFASEEEPLAALLGAALGAAGLPADYAVHPLTVSVLEGPRAALIVAVNETASESVARPRLYGRALALRVPAQSSRMLLVASDTGAVLGHYPD
jgi:hypothetical protein